MPDTPIVGEIFMAAFNFAPPNYLPCDGRLLPIDEYSELFPVIGTTFGGDGQITFALPDLRGRAPIKFGQGPGLSSRTLADVGGSITAPLTGQNLAVHNHTVSGVSTTGDRDTPAGNAWAADAAAQSSVYAAGPGTTAMSSQCLSTTGGGQEHENMQPFLVLNFYIAVYGIYPSQIAPPVGDKGN